jgi:predicted small lipoprotein YifL
MKKIVSLVLALMLALSLVACGNSGNTTQTPAPSTTPNTSATPAPSTTPEVQEPSFSADLTEFYNNMMNAAGEAPFMMDLTEDPDMLEMTYPGLKDIETKQLIAVMPGMSAVAMEFVFVEVANAADVDTVKGILQGRIDAQVNGGAWYPETIEQWEKYSEIVVIDNFVCLFVTPDKDGLIDAFRNGTEIPLWAEAPIYLSEFYMTMYDQLYPMDDEGNYTGPYAEDITWYDGAEEMIEMYYPGLTAIDANQLHVYIPGMSFSAYEVVLIEVVNESDVDAVKAILQARVDAQAAGGAWYPEAVEGWVNNARIVSNGCYIMLAVGADCDTFVEGFNSLF